MRPTHWGGHSVLLCPLIQMVASLLSCHTHNQPFPPSGLYLNSFKTMVFLGPLSTQLLNRREHAHPWACLWWHTPCSFLSCQHHGLSHSALRTTTSGQSQNYFSLLKSENHVTVDMTNRSVKFSWKALTCPCASAFSERFTNNDSVEPGLLGRWIAMNLFLDFYKVW